jgi:hypothetical protein
MYVRTDENEGLGVAVMTRIRDVLGWKLGSKTVTLTEMIRNFPQSPMTNAATVC